MTKLIRKCISCGAEKDRSEMIRVTYDKQNDEVVLNMNSKIFGRSVYLCYNKMCIEKALKKNRMKNALKATISDELKGKLIEFDKY